MSIKKILTKVEIESIYSAANSAVWHSHARASRLTKAREEDYIATLVTNGVQLLANQWIEILSPKGIDLKISGVFCHGHPQVSFGSPKSQVELADLLVVHQHSTKTTTIARAILVQAKMSTDSTHKLPPNDPQLTLFATWPHFEFVTGGLTPGFRNINESGKGSRYALVLDGHSYPEQIRWADQCPWASCCATQILSAERSFSKLLGDLLLGNDGRVVRLRFPKDDWSRMIKELLEITGKKTYRRKKIMTDSTPRLSAIGNVSAGTLCVAYAQRFTKAAITRSRATVSELFFGGVADDQIDGRDKKSGVNIAHDKDDGGIPVLIIETRAAEQ